MSAISKTLKPIVALTGGIGCGKSVASLWLQQQFKIPVVDVDSIARELTLSNTPILQQIRQQFGDRFFSSDGQLIRSQLRRHIFSDTREKQKLEAIMHPPIRALAEQHLQHNDAQYQPAYHLLVVPLLFEIQDYRNLYDVSVVIDCEPHLQNARVRARSQLDSQEVLHIQKNQMTREERMQHADIVIHNNGSLEELYATLTKLHHQLLAKFGTS